MKKQIYKVFKAKNRTFGIDKRFLNKEELEILKEFAEYVKNNNIKCSVEIVVVSTDKYKIINRINIYITNDKYDLTFKNVYVGRVFGTDRIFDCLYKFEYLLSDLINDKFDHYKEYSLSNKYKLI